MSGILRFHDLTYKLLGQILKLAFQPVAWSVGLLTEAVLEALDPIALKLLEQADKNPEKEIARLIYYAKSRGYINNKFQTTKTGAEKLEKLQFTTLEYQGEWDKKWRIVMYDIPEDKRRARDQVRRLIKQLGFVQLQRSVWVHPLPCLKQFRAIKEANRLEDSLVLVETSKLEGDGKYRRHFKQIYPQIEF